MSLFWLLSASIVAIAFISKFLLEGDNNANLIRCSSCSRHFTSLREKDEHYLLTHRHTPRTAPISVSNVVSEENVVELPRLKQQLAQGRHYYAPPPQSFVTGHGERYLFSSVHHRDYAGTARTLHVPERRISPGIRSPPNLASIVKVKRFSGSAFHCQWCSRTFSTFADKEQHRKADHPDETSHKCPFCHSAHVSSYAVVQHLESGNCPSRANRQCIDKYIFNATGRTSSEANAIVTRNVPRFDSIIYYRATETAMNSRGYYQCYFCPDKKFRTLRQLNQHLESPKHSRRTPGLYSCPTCGFNTQTLSGLIQHAEMGNCGIRQNVRVRGALKNVTNGMKQIST